MSFTVQGKSALGALLGGAVFVTAGIVALVLLTPRYIEPAMRNHDFEETTCTVVEIRDNLPSYSVEDKDCTASYPCKQVLVKYDQMPPIKNSSHSGNTTARKGYIIYKNENVMDNFAKKLKRFCSAIPDKCSTTNKNKKMINDFVDEYGKIGEEYDCFYNTKRSEDVIISKEYNDVTIFLCTFFPCLAILLGGILLAYMAKYHVNKYCRSGQAA